MGLSTVYRITGVSWLALGGQIGHNSSSQLNCCSPAGVPVTDDQSGGKSLYQKVRLYTLVGIAVLAVIVIFQNTEDVKTHLLFWTIEMPRAALLSVTVLAGFTGGVICMGLRRRR